VFEPQAITILGFGEAGSTIARGLCEQGVDATQLQAVDTDLHQGSRGERMKRQAEQYGVAVKAEYTDAIATSDLVISVVTGEDATAAANMAKPWLKSGTLYADYNSITGPQTRRVAAVFDASGIDFVDVAVMGSFMASGHAAPLLVAGERAQDMTDWANSVAIPARLLNEKVGDASAVKILRSIMMKGIEALSVECLVAAHRQGLVDQVLDNVGDVDSIGFSNWVKTLTVTHLVHAKRRMEEVEKAIENLNETGMQALMSEATRQSHLRTVQAGFDAAEVADLDLKGALTMLDQRIFRK
jgi:3-hydroxyisobutyrate dehydrogenase-like beta-hydroxyacid dehydrogenase